MPNPAKQLNFCDISTDFNKFYNHNQNYLPSLLIEFIDISDFIPFSFYQKYYSHFGSKRSFSLGAMLNVFIIKNILSISSTSLLVTFLSISSELRKLCGFLRVPHKSQFSRFKLNFLYDFNDSFNTFVDYTEDISEKINPF